MDTKSEIAVEKFLSGYNCAQSVLFAHADAVGIDSESALKIATGLGAGIARRGETCGALTGGILAIGLKFGRGAGQDRSATECAYQKTQALMAEFEKQHGSTHCRALVNGCDLMTPEGQAEFKAQDLLRKRCVGYVTTVCGSLERLLE